MSGGAILGLGHNGDGLFLSGVTAQVDLGFHPLECFCNPNICSQGITFALWIKQDHGADKGLVLDNGASRYSSEGKCLITLCVQSIVTQQTW